MASKSKIKVHFYMEFQEHLKAEVLWNSGSLKEAGAGENYQVI